MLNPFYGSFHTLFQPLLCLGCGTLETKSLCRFCRQHWTPSIQPYSDILDDAPLYALWFGNTITYRAFRQWKLTGAPHLRRLLEKIDPKLLSSLQARDFTAVVPIPQDRRRSWNRGFESAVVAAGIFARALDLPLSRALALRESSSDIQQAKRDRMERSLSQNPFYLDKRYSLPRRILVVDDVVTTGATLQHAISTIQNAGLGTVVEGAALVYKPASPVFKRSGISI